MTSAPDSPWRRALFIFALVLAGEAIFSLPFHVTRYFKPTVLEVFGFSNTDLGSAMAAYGVVAMLSYFPGGPLADRFSPRKLMALSLVLTALGGLYMATIPDVVGMGVLWAFWGMTTILLFWAPMIRATRLWGGDDEQGTAFGILDGGRGLTAVILGLIAAQGFAMVMPEQADLVTAPERAEALRMVIYAYIGGTLAAAALVWFAIPEASDGDDSTQPTRRVLPKLLEVIKRPAIWLQAMIVVCSYVAYKSTDNFGLFALDVLDMDEVEAAWISTVSSWVRPVAALAAGLIADRWLSSRVVSVLFVVLGAVYGFLALVPSVGGSLAFFVVEVVVACIAIYGLRGVYFALFEEAKIPTAVTGTAVGIVSVIGYTPDVFFGVVTGYFLDTFPGVVGHQIVCGFITVTALVGMITSITFTWHTRRLTS